MVQDKVVTIRMSAELRQQLKQAAGDPRRMSTIARAFIVEGLKTMKKEQTPNEKPS